MRENLKERTERIVKDFADYAIDQSSTYSEAIQYIQKTASFTEYGQAVKKAIQDEITKRALDSKIL